MFLHTILNRHKVKTDSSPLFIFVPSRITLQNYSTSKDPINKQCHANLWISLGYQQSKP